MKKAIVSVDYKNNTALINLVIDSFPQHTKDMPETVGVLKKQLPSIFSNKCFNEENQSFYKEVQNTQTAHLFEHIILEKMALAKLKYQKSASYDGRTLWYKNAKNGYYQIQLTFPLVDWPIFVNALNQSINLVNSITAKHYIN